MWVFGTNSDDVVVSSGDFFELVDEALSTCASSGFVVASLERLQDGEHSMYAHTCRAWVVVPFGCAQFPSVSWA